MTAETIIVNGAVRTMDPAHPVAEAVAISDGCILAIGTTAEIEAMATGGTARIDAGGGSVLPGFIESHAHLFIGGAELENLQLDNCADAKLMGEMIRDFAAAHPDRPMVVAQAPDYGVFGDRAPRLLLDEILKDRPLALVAHDHHTVWANTAALEAAGDLHGRATSPGHEVVMGDDGLATGALLEPEAFGPVMRLSGQERTTLGLRTGGEPDRPPTDAERESDLAHLVRGLAHAARLGVTSIVNMDGNVYTLELLEELKRRGELIARVRVPFHFVPEMEAGDLDTACEMAERWNDEWLSSGFVKMFMDGVIDSRTAFMKNDYPGQSGYRSHGRFEADRFADLATRINAMGLSIAVHAIGDAAISRTIDAYAASGAANGAHGMRNRIEHLELVAPEDFARIGDLGITASIQPPHAPGTAGLPLQPTLDNIGRARWADAFAWQRLVEAGAPIALGSDWPVADLNPLVGLHAATTRDAWADDVPDHRFTLDAALSGCTIGGAWAEATDDIKGSLTAGKLADLTILDRDIGRIPNAAIPDAEVAATIVGGKTVYRRL
ncbi:amidohydrolase [Ovoidimarina sediminis]|uniref:amidohydrolase n=1 Tax=Ovoidimarina sediminis TaxID=3079856 RepID=UPI0029099DD2|nr:amidohydrolase [Rhodophyticola sp. MJ-SS7]MDU8942611.1 amidohydrolase [Rhodophyticola sp. MJ-SS7]